MKKINRFFEENGERYGIGKFITLKQGGEK